MPLAERFDICPRAFIFRTISQPRALSSDISAAGRGLFIMANNKQNVKIFSAKYSTLEMTSCYDTDMIMVL